MPKIIFGGNSGAYVTKKRKRMPGTDSSRKPELKTWDPLNPNSSKDVYVQYNLLNNASLATGEGLPAYTQCSWQPVLLNMPNVGTGPVQRVGDRILWKFLKIKGYVMCCRNLQQPINWRLILFRVEKDFQSDSVTRTWYLNHYKMAITTNVTTAANSVPFCQQNYYIKINDPDQNLGWKRKVIASGSCPVTSNIYSADLILRDQGTGYDSYPYFGNNVVANGNVGMTFPIDVTININDNVEQNTIAYYLLLEVDCGHGWQHAASGEPSTGDSRTLSVQYNPMFLNFICKGYFYDY